MDKVTKKKYRHHKLFRWIALFVKILSIPLLQFIFIGFRKEITLPLSHQTMALSAFLSTAVALFIYYTIIFLLDRRFNFHVDNSGSKAFLIYWLVVSVLLVLESVYSTPLQNALYRLTGLGLVSGETVIMLATVTNKLVYLLLGFLVQFLFGLLTSIIVFNLFRFLLGRRDHLQWFACLKNI